MSTVEVAITPYIDAGTLTEAANTAILMTWLNESPDAPEEVKRHRPWRITTTTQVDDDTIVFIVGEAADWSLPWDDDFEEADVQEAIDEISFALRALPGWWELDNISVDAEDM